MLQTFIYIFLLYFLTNKQKILLKKENSISFFAPFNIIYLYFSFSFFLFMDSSFILLFLLFIFCEENWIFVAWCVDLLQCPNKVLSALYLCGLLLLVPDEVFCCWENWIGLFFLLGCRKKCTVCGCKEL